MEFKGLQHSEARNINPVYLGPETPKSGRFMTLSVLIHAAMVAGVTLMGIPVYETPVKNVVEFEVESDKIGPAPIPDGKPDIAPSQGPTAPPVVSAEEPPKEAPVIAQPARTVTAPPAPQQKLMKVAPAPLVTAPAPQQQVQRSAPEPVPVQASLDDIQAPDLETSDHGEVEVAKLDDKDLNDDFERVDQTHNKALDDAQKELEDEAKKVADANEETLAQAEKENQEQAKALAAAAAARRAKDAKAIADAQAAETTNEGVGQGAGPTGSPEPTKEVAGIPGGVRALDQLRQMPGNKFPQYDKEERLQRQEGAAIFYAYVNKDGSLSQFKLGKSTGFRNLDGKTLAALKKWKFYPGQEGWVEMPYQWVLKGDALEAGGQLRSRIK